MLKFGWRRRNGDGDGWVCYEAVLSFGEGGGGDNGWRVINKAPTLWTYDFVKWLLVGYDGVLPPQQAS